MLEVMSSLSLPLGYGDDDAYDDVMSVDLSPEAPSTGTLPSAARPPPRVR